MRTLVVGARKGSLGDAIVETLLGSDFGVEVATAGITGEEGYALDVLDPSSIRKALAGVQPGTIICTVGVNLPREIREDGFEDVWMRMMAVNSYGPLNLLRQWRAMLPYIGGHFVAISSNSASIARTGSTGYCMSKAALSMGIRCAAREFARETGPSPIVYAWEFGLLAGTPMTNEFAGSYGGALHRMPGIPAPGLSISQAAWHVVNAAIHGGRELNGCTLRIDAGEQ